MAQLFLATITIDSTPFQSSSYGGSRLNFVGAELNGVACVIVIEGPDGQKTINVAANGIFIRQATATERFTITGNGAKVTIELSGPDPYEYTDPRTFILSNGVTILSTGGSDPTNPVNNPILATPSLLSYTVPAGKKLLLNSVVGQVQNGATAGRVTSITSAKLTLSGSIGAAVVLANDGTGGALAASKLYAIAAYEAGSPTVVADVASATQMFYPQTLVAGDVIAFTVVYAGGTDAVQTLGIQGVLTPL